MSDRERERDREQDSLAEQTVCSPPKIHCLLLGHLITKRLCPTQFTNSIKILVKSRTQAERDGERVNEGWRGGGAAGETTTY